jgi:hypothetical protein
MPASPDYDGYLDVENVKWFPAAEEFHYGNILPGNFDSFSGHGALWPMSPRVGSTTCQQPVVPSNDHILVFDGQVLRPPPEFGSVADTSSFSGSIGTLGMPSGSHDVSSPLGSFTSIKDELDDLSDTPKTSRRQRKVKTAQHVLKSGKIVSVTVHREKAHACGSMHPKTGQICRKIFNRPEHCKRHQRACKIARAQAEDDGHADNTPYPRCLLHGHNQSWCKPKGEDPRVDNLWQHLATHCKKGRNKCVNADFLHYLLAHEFEESGLDSSKADSVMKSVVNGVMREVRKKVKESKPVEEGTPNITLMASHPLYSKFVQDYALGKVDLKWDDKVKSVFARGRREQSRRLGYSVPQQPLRGVGRRQYKL